MKEPKAVSSEVSFPDKVQIIQAVNTTLSFYRFLYGMVGGDIGWVDRQLMDDDKLKALISRSMVDIYVLYYDGVPAGYAELDRTKEGEITLDYFGLAPEFRGRGLGKSFLDWTIQKVWSFNPKVFKLQTCELDHPKALPNYLKAGFEIIEKKLEQQTIVMVV